MGFCLLKHVFTCITQELISVLVTIIIIPKLILPLWRPMFTIMAIPIDFKIMSRNIKIHVCL